MSTYKVTAWRDTTGVRGISVHTRTSYGWDNITADVTLIGEGEVERFLDRCREAWERARRFAEPTHEEAPGAYDGWDGDD